MRYLYGLVAALFLLSQTVLALSPAEWRSQSIYFLLTDRFGRTDKSTTASCDLSKRVSDDFGLSRGHCVDWFRNTVVVPGRGLSIR